MEEYKQEFIRLMVDSNVLTFGDFTTKSGRKTPFFINTGKYEFGGQFVLLGEFYAGAVTSHFKHGDFNVLYGPAYKGIVLAAAVAMAFWKYADFNMPFCYNRKEAKDHGEGGSLIGHKPKDGEKILIIEDVITAGTSIRESVALLKAAADVSIAGAVVSVDRMERGANSEKSAIKEIEEEFGFPVFSIVNLDEIVEYLSSCKG